MADELEQYLASIERDANYQVKRVLKESASETTELISKDGSETLLIRKRIAADSGIGLIYERLFEEQKQGNKAHCTPTIIECFQTESGLTVVMEHIDGKTLADVVYEADPSVELAAELFPLICDAVSELHEAFDPPIIHRDLKPSNIIVGDDGVKIIDFGIARTYRSDAERDTHHFGTPSYAPPEQFGFGQTDTRSDVYALGMLLYYCLTERTPSFSIVDAGLAEEAIPEPIRDVILRATAFDPSHRYQSASALKRAFLSAMEQVNAETLITSAEVPSTSSELKAPLPTPLPPDPDMLVSPAFPEEAPVVRSPITYATMPDARIGFGSGEIASSKVHKLPMIPKPVAYAWNIFVLLSWMMLIASCCFAAFVPNESDAQYGILVRILIYPILLGASFTVLAFAIMHKPYLKPFSSLLARFGAGKVDAICVLGFVTLVILAAIVNAIAIVVQRG